MSHLFDPQYTPPFPTLPVVIRDPEAGAITPVLTAHIDTGADVTIVPTRHVRSLSRETTFPARLRSQWGEARTVHVYVVDLEVAGHNLPAVDIIADNRGNEILLGRNVLNRLILLLDGPRTQTDVLTRRPPRL